MASASSRPPASMALRDRANSTTSDVVMSDPTDAESPTTDPAAYSDAQQDDTDITERMESSSPVCRSNGLPTSQAKSIFFRLPKELRIRIYSECLRSVYSVLWPIERLQLGLQPQLLRVCHGIYTEASPILYSNMLHFCHPSDSNMFLWAHNPQLGRDITRILFQVRDRDLKVFWSSYLGSTMLERSLKFDYPNLRTLHVQFRTNWLHSMVDHMHTRFQHWDLDKHLKELCSCLQGNVPEDCDVRVLSCCRVRYEDAKELYARHAGDLEHVDGFSAGKPLLFRTAWKRVPGAHVAMEIEGC